jgi:segregation and condensation protein B
MCENKDIGKVQDSELSLKYIVEALLFASETPLTLKELAGLTDKSVDSIKIIISALQDDYKDRGINLVNVANGYRFLTSKKYYSVIAKIKDNERKMSLSRASMETLAIIAYRQNITAGEIATLRGVQSVSHILRNLQEMELIAISGRKEVLGRPLQYVTTVKFMEVFGISSLSELPTLEEIGVEE